MKKNYFAAFAVAISFTCFTAQNTNAQFAEHFDGISNLANVTVGTSTYKIGGLPANWTQINGDGLTPKIPIFGTNAWATQRASLDGITIDTFAISTSYYTAAGASDDWLISPQVTMPATGNNFLTWEASASSSQYTDGYVIKVSTATNAKADFTSQVFSIAKEGTGGWKKHAIDLSAFNGQNIYIAIVNNSTNGEVLMIDDIVLQNIAITDAELTRLKVERFSATNSDVTIGGTIKNNGLPITKLAMTWTDGTSIFSDTLKGLNIAPFDTYNFTHAIAFNKSTVDEFNISFAITAVNSGATESNITNNVGTAKISTIANMPKKRVVLEEGTGAWCGWCPRGLVGMAGVSDDPTYNDDFIGIAVHNQDVMTNTAYDAALGIKSFPSMFIDRKYLAGDASLAVMQSAVSQLKSVATPVAVIGASTLNTSTRALSVKVSATFKTKISENVNLAVVLVEDSVHGTASTYNQTNYYSSSAANQPLEGAGHNWQTETNPVPAAKMYYNHVGRELIGGFKGLAGSVPTTIIDGTTAEHTFAFTIPAAYVLKNLKVVALCVNGTTGEIYNAFGLNANGTFSGVSEINTEDINMNVFPNPITSNSSFKVAFNLKENKTVSVNVYSSNGELVYSQKNTKLAGNQVVDVVTTNWAAGSYVVNVTYDSNSFAKSITVIK